MRTPSIPLAIAVVAALAACQAATESTQPAQDVAALAIDALAADLGIPKESIQVEGVRAVEWRDSSIGCPKPDVAYMQVITPGHEVRLRAGGNSYVVHEAKNRAFVCHPAPKVASKGSTLPFGRQMLEAQQDLARHLNVPATEIKLVGSGEASWGDASLGCPEPGMQYAQVVTKGRILKFRHREREYTYHADATRAIPCPGIATD
jgi:hypothetical protein